MKTVKVVKIDKKNDSLIFDDGSKLFSNHDSDCCESHYLSMSDLTLDDFEDLEFNLTNGNFFNRVEDYGIELIPIKGYVVRIPGYGFNNGYYSSQLDLVIIDSSGNNTKYNINECQVIYG